jgi:hypothetical protein
MKKLFETPRKTAVSGDVVLADGTIAACSS